MRLSLYKENGRRSGVILAYSAAAKGGVIQSQSSRTYFFEVKEWGHHDSPPQPGEQVTFEESHKLQAIKVKRLVLK